jgi:predicted hydrocarbon binding protein
MKLVLSCTCFRGSGKMKSTNDNKIPRTGRIGRLTKILEKKVSKNVLERVMEDSWNYKRMNSKEKAAWWREAMPRLEQELGRKKTEEIMEACGRKCCGTTFRKLGIKYWKESESMKEFLEKLNVGYSYKGKVYGIGGGRLKLEDENTITGGYDTCYCGQVKNTEKPFPNDIYCRCGAGWLKQFFESALKKPVKVKAIQTYIQGTKSCEFEIRV